MAIQVETNQFSAQVLAHLHPASLKCYPTLASDVALVCGDGAPWTLSAFTEIVPASTIASNFDIIGIVISGAAQDQYELVLYYGASDTEFGRVRFAAGAAGTHVGFIPFESPMIAANSKIRAKLAGLAGVDESGCGISIVYHIHS